MTDQPVTIRERIADLCHEQWSGWMDYLFSKGTFSEDGTWTMPAWAVERWKRQAETPYAKLSESEQDSDRKEADKFLAITSVLPACPYCKKPLVRSKIATHPSALYAWMCDCDTQAGGIQAEIFKARAAGMSLTITLKPQNAPDKPTRKRHPVSSQS